eukprot:Ihof_evm8s162 gene=Ihof_evmTU8s162
MLSRAQFVLFLGLALLSVVQAIGVLSIDLGSQWVKVGLVKRGVAADIVLNNESKRKSPNAILLNQKERLFGNPAKSAGLRYPGTLFEFLPGLLGLRFDHPLVARYQQQFPQHKLIATERNTVAFQTDQGVYSVEELVAMILENTRDMGSEFAGEPMNSVVITVPAFWGQAERQALLYAADLVGINVIQLLDDNTAVALGYGVFHQERFMDKPMNVLFYDQGASHTTATLVEYDMRSKKTGDKTPGLKIKSLSFDRTLGGLEFDLRLQEHLIKLFEKQKKGDHSIKIRESPRAMAKMLKEAQRIKEVLSANVETFAQIEGVLPDVDFERTKITRLEFETMCEDLFARAAKPVTDALVAANMNIEDVHDVIMFGGSQRIPKVQSMLTDVAGGKELGKSINADEGAAIGAVLRAAAFSKGFRVKEFIVEDTILYPISVAYPNADDSKKTNVTRVLYPTQDKYPEVKLLGFQRHVHDFNFTVSYGDLDFLSKAQKETVGCQNLMQVSLTGLTDAIKKYENMEYLGTKVRFSIDYSGILKVASATASFNDSLPETLASKMLGKVKDIIGLQKDEEATVEEEGTPINADAEEKEAKGVKFKFHSVDKNDTKIDVNVTNSNSTVKEAKKEAKPEKPKIKKVELKLGVTHLEISLPGGVEMHEAKERLTSIRVREVERMQAMEAKHKLESSIYAMYDELEGEGIAEVSATEQLDEIRVELGKISDWLYEEGVATTTDKYRAKSDNITTMTRDLFKRRDELLARPQAIIDLQKAFKRLIRVKNMDEATKFFTQEAYDKVAKSVNEIEAWLNKKIEEQKTT